MNLSSSPTSGNGHPPAAKLLGVSKTYLKPDGTVLVEALRAVDLDIVPGEYLTIMGASGSGKSTLMNILGCLDRPSAGPAPDWSPTRPGIS